jgi:hypothetical protein
MENYREFFFTAFPRRHDGRGMLYAVFTALMLFLCANSAEAKSHGKKTHEKHSSSSSVKHTSPSKSSKKHGSTSSKAYDNKSSKKHGSSSSKSSRKRGSSRKKSAPPEEVALRSTDYPREISGRIAAYNSELEEIKALSHKDPKMAMARGEVLKIKRESFEVYSNFMSSMSGREADRIRKTVAEQGWYKGMPQIAFVVSKGLPDDIETLPDKNGSRIKLIYKSVGTYYFEKGTLRSFGKAG